MKKHLLLTLAAFLCISMSAETYTIVFNSNEVGDGKETNKLEALVLTATDNCMDRIVSTVKVARAKPGFGIKGGTGTEMGKITFGLDDTYKITTMTVYAACFDNSTDKSKAYGINVCDKHIDWNKEHITEIYPYQLTFNAQLDTISIAAVNAKNNRWYVQKIEFETAENPHPTKAIIEMQYPTMDFGGEKWVDKDEVLEDILNFNIVGKHIKDKISLKFATSDTIFSLTSDTLPANGGEVGIFYRIQKDTVINTITFYNSVIATATGLDDVERSRALPITFTLVKPSAGGISTINLDTTRMAIGSMPGNYYKFAQGTADSTLKNHLGYIICVGKRYRYGSGTKQTWDGFFYTDRDPETNQVLDMYSNNLRYFNPEKPTASVAEFDIEHMLPKSWWGGDVNPAYCDLFHLVPGDYSANRSKSNHAPGIPADTTFNNGSFVTGSGAPYGLQKVFCPADEYKGDFARAYFYIATCYGDSLTWIEKGEPGVAMTNEGWQEFRPWLRDLLLDWHRKDPVSEKELKRAIEVNKIQGNRNPFIDYPELVEYIWGNKQGQVVDFSTLMQSYGNPYDETPTQCTSVEVQLPAAQKYLRNGNLHITIGERTFTILGQQ